MRFGEVGRPAPSAGVRLALSGSQGELGDFGSDAAKLVKQTFQSLFRILQVAGLAHVLQPTSVRHDCGAPKCPIEPLRRCADWRSRVAFRLATASSISPTSLSQSSRNRVAISRKSSRSPPTLAMARSLSSVSSGASSGGLTVTARAPARTLHGAERER